MSTNNRYDGLYENHIILYIEHLEIYNNNDTNSINLMQNVHDLTIQKSHFDQSTR